MKIFFMRHADSPAGSPDELRPISADGEMEIDAVCRWLKNLGVGFSAAYSSPLLRAKQTAGRMVAQCGEIRTEEVVPDDALMNESPMDYFSNWLNQLDHPGNVLLVGHVPSVAARVRHLLGITQAAALRFPTAGVACLDRVSPKEYELNFFITPALLRGC
jgi:phosphohistidine phosphatase SixA